MQRVANRPTTWGRGLQARTAIAGKTILCVMDMMVTRVQVSSNNVSNNETPTPRGEHLKLGYEASPRNCGPCSSGNARPTGLPQPSVAPSLATLPSAPLTPVTPASWVFSSTLGLFLCPLCLGCPSWTDISVAHSGAPFSPLLKQHILSKLFST